MHLRFVFLASVAIVCAFAPANTVQELEARVAAALPTTRALATLREVADKFHVRAWLLGGSATTYALHSLDTEASDESLAEFSTIFRPNQDLDVVVDAPAAIAEKIEEELESLLPYRRSDGAHVWEVRSLRFSRGDKEALLASADVQTDFPKQHTDSLSQGLMEVTQPPAGESRFRDAMDFERAASRFAEDLVARQIRFLFSPNHQTTKRFREGANPELFSVVRYYTKVLQFGVKGSNDDESAIKSIVLRFDPAHDMTSAYAERWLQRNGKKMIHNALDIASAFKKLDQVGLAEALRKASTNRDVDSLRWWLSRRPLPAFTVGTGGGATAKSLNISQVTHATSGLVGYWSLVRTADGRPNAFMSRNGVQGEHSVDKHPGFYMAEGEAGGRDTGFDISFQLDPNARLGTDFTQPAHHTIALLNRNAAHRTSREFDASPEAYLASLLTDPDRQKGSTGILSQAFGSSALERWMVLGHEARQKILWTIALHVTTHRNKAIGPFVRAVAHWPGVLAHGELVVRILRRAALAKDFTAANELADAWNRAPLSPSEEATIVQAVFPVNASFPPVNELPYWLRLMDRERFRVELQRRLEPALRGMQVGAHSATIDYGLRQARFPGRGRWIVEHCVPAFRIFHAQAALHLVLNAADDLPLDEAKQLVDELLPRTHLPYFGPIVWELLTSPFWYRLPAEAVSILERIVTRFNGGRKKIDHLDQLLAFAPVPNEPPWGALPEFLAFAERTIIEKLQKGNGSRATQQLFRWIVRAGGNNFDDVLATALSSTAHADRQNPFRFPLAVAPIGDDDSAIRELFLDRPEAVTLIRRAFLEMADDKRSDGDLVAQLADALGAVGTSTDAARVVLWKSGFTVHAVEAAYRKKKYYAPRARTAACGHTIAATPTTAAYPEAVSEQP